MPFIEINILWKFQTIYLKYVYFTDQNTLNFWSFFSISTGIFSNRFLRFWWNYLKLCTNVQEDRLIKRLSQIFFLPPNVHFTDRKVVNLAIFSTKMGLETWYILAWMRKWYFQMRHIEIDILWKFHSRILKNVYFTDQKALLGYRPFFYRRSYLCNCNSYNVETYQAHVFGAYKSSVKIWYCLLLGCVFYRPESGTFGHF